MKLIGILLMIIGIAGIAMGGMMFGGYWSCVYNRCAGCSPVWNWISIRRKENTKPGKII